MEEYPASASDTTGPVEHLCLVATSDAELGTGLATFVSDGLQRNEQCVCFLGQGSRSALTAALPALGLDATELRERRVLLFEPGGDASTIRRSLSDLRDAARGEGFAGVCCALEPARHAIDGADVVAREAAIDEAVLLSSVSVLCVLDTRTHAPWAVADAIRCHERVIVAGVVHANPGYEPPALALSPEGSTRLSFALSRLTQSTAEPVVGVQDDLYSSVFMNTPDGIAVIDRDLTIIGVNAVAARLYDQGPIVGKKCFQVFRAAEERCVECPCLRSMETGEAARTVEPRFDASGRPTGWMELRSFPLRNRTSGEICGAIEYARDVTDTLAVEEERRRLSSVVEQAGESVLITDPDGTVCYVNSAFERDTGYTRDEVLGRHPRLLGAGERDDIYFQGIMERLVRGEGWTGRLTKRRKDGTTYEEEATMAPVRDPAGNIVNFVAMGRDVTREVALEQQLHQAMKMEVVGRLAGGVAHDFNNLLAVILSYANLVASNLEDDDPLRQDVQEIVTAGKRAAALTRQLLIFSRREVVQPQVIHINGVVEQMDKLLRRTLGEDIELRTHLAGEPWRVLIDPGQLEQVLINLAVNARDAMPGVGRLTIASENVVIAEGELPDGPEVPPGRYVRLSVTDTGNGMAPDVAARVFEPFFTTKPKGKGTGLGLSTVYGIVTQAGGHVTFETRAGEGTRFRILLPEVDEERVAGDSAEPTVTDGLGETILVVEDEDAVRSGVRRILSQHGYVVLEARHGNEALDVSQRHDGPIHALLTDVVMPQMSGKELAGRLLAQRPDTRLLYMSGYDDDVIAERGALAAGVSYLAKPFTRQGLLQKIRQVLDRREPVSARLAQ